MISSTTEILESLVYVYTFNDDNNTGQGNENVNRSTLSSLSAVCDIYSSGLQSDEYIATDFFVYILYNSFNNFSVPANVTIHVKRSLSIIR